MCDCTRGYPVDTSMGVRVCCHCGIALPGNIYIQPHVSSCCPSRPPYCKKKRFVRLLHNVWASRTSCCKDGFMKALDDFAPESPESIFGFIRASKERTFKRYDCIATLSTQFIPGHTIQPLVSTEVVWATACFTQVQRLHHRLQGVFPAYGFLIELVLANARPPRRDLLRYVHTLKCKKRRTLYTERYGFIFKRPVGDAGVPASCQNPLRRWGHR